MLRPTQAAAAAAAVGACGVALRGADSQFWAAAGLTAAERVGGGAESAAAAAAAAGIEVAVASFAAVAGLAEETAGIVLD